MMIETQELLSYLGGIKTEPSLITYMNNLKVDVLLEAQLKKDQYGNYCYKAVNIERKSCGYWLVFSDESYFLGLRNQPLGAGSLYFSAVFFYSEGKEGYSQYSGELPFELSFEDNRESVHLKLGESSWQRLARESNRVISERWDELHGVPYRLHITYNKNTGKISSVSATIPDRIENS